MVVGRPWLGARDEAIAAPDTLVGWRFVLKLVGALGRALRGPDRGTAPAAPHRECTLAATSASLLLCDHIGDGLRRLDGLLLLRRRCFLNALETNLRRAVNDHLGRLLHADELDILRAASCVRVSMLELAAHGRRRSWPGAGKFDQQELNKFLQPHAELNKN